MIDPLFLCAAIAVLVVAVFASALFGSERGGVHDPLAAAIVGLLVVLAGLYGLTYLLEGWL